MAAHVGGLHVGGLHVGGLHVGGLHIGTTLGGLHVGGLHIEVLHIEGLHVVGGLHTGGVHIRGCACSAYERAACRDIRELVGRSRTLHMHPPICTPSYMQSVGRSRTMSLAFSAMAAVVCKGCVAEWRDLNARRMGEVREVAGVDVARCRGGAGPPLHVVGGRTSAKAE